MDSQAPSPEIGRVVGGKYRLTRLLGRGGMGSVFEGVHATLGTRFAIKYIDTAFALRSDVRTRFANEALAAARLKSKHIVEVYDHGIDERGSPYIVMEFLSGEPLDKKLARETRLDVSETCVILLQVARALERAHAAAIVHRDLKPENVFLVWDDEDQKSIVKVVDFGIAKFTDGSGIESSTKTGAVLGTPHYMSPEQARGLRTVDFAADVWSLGVIAYRCVTGRAPFDGEAMGDLLVKICTLPHLAASTLVDVPEGFDEWIAKSLQKDPRQRFASVVEQAEALRAVATRDNSAFDLKSAGRHQKPPSISLATAPMLHPPEVMAQGMVQRTADTAGGLERTSLGASWTSRPWWWATLATGAAALGALVFVLVQRSGAPVAESANVARSDVAEPAPLVAGEAELGEKLDADGTPVVSPVTRVPDAGTSANELDLAAGHPVVVPPPRAAPRPHRETRPGRKPGKDETPPRPADPEDELGY